MITLPTRFPGALVGPGQREMAQYAPEHAHSVLDGILTHSFTDVEGILSACARGTMQHPHPILASSSQWLGVQNLDEAFSLARTGWQEGADMALSLFSSLESRMAKSLIPILATTDEPGAFDPAAYYSGEEYYFLGHTPSDSTAEGRPEAVTIYFDSFISGAVAADAQVKRGVTVAALAYIMERSGIATSIYLSSRSKVYGQGSVQTDEVLFRVKAFGQPIMLPHVAFWLGHPSVDRAIVSGGVVSPWHKSDSYAPGPKRVEESDTVVVEPMVYHSGWNADEYLTEQLKRFKLINVEVGG